MSSEIRIVPLAVGSATRPKSDLVWGASPEPIEFAITMFYLRADGHHIIVDTGIPPVEEAQARRQPMARTAEQDPLVALGTLGLGKDDIDIVINTHLHWDHCSNNHLFDQATILVQRTELQYAMAPLPIHRGAYDEIETEHGECRFMPSFLRVRPTTVDGDFDVSPRIRLLRTPGHSPGMQSILVRGATSTYLLPGDNVPFYENLDERGPDYFKPTLLHVDLEDFFQSVRRSTALADVVLPSHDQRVYEPGEYR